MPCQNLVKINFVVGAALHQTFECQQSLVIRSFVIRQLFHLVVPPIVQFGPRFCFDRNYHINRTHNGYNRKVSNCELWKQRKYKLNVSIDAITVNRTHVISCNVFSLTQKRFQIIKLFANFGCMLFDLIFAKFLEDYLPLQTWSVAWISKISRVCDKQKNLQ